MNILMHLKLAQVIRKSIEKELNIRINKFSFMYGNIKPDLYSKSIPHYKHSALGFIQEEIEDLSAHNFNKTGRWSKKSSERMGIITHYLSDFFCYAHSKYFPNEILSHYLYEFRLLSYFRKDQKVVSSRSVHNLADKLTSSPKIINYINETHEKYISMIKDNPSPYEVDTVNAVWVNTVVCVSIISLCLENQIADRRDWDDNSLFHGYLPSANQWS